MSREERCTASKRRRGPANMTMYYGVLLVALNDMTGVKKGDGTVYNSYIVSSIRVSKRPCPPKKRHAC